MRRASVLLPKVVTFRNDLIRYGTLLTEDRHQEAEQLRAELNVQWGDLQSDLDELDIPRFLHRVDGVGALSELAEQVGLEVSAVIDVPLHKSGGLNARPRSTDDYAESVVVLRAPAVSDPMDAREGYPGQIAVESTL